MKPGNVLRVCLSSTTRLSKCWLISPGLSFHYLLPAMDGTCSSMTPLIAGAAVSQSAVVRRLNTVLSRNTIGSLHTRLWGRRVETSNFNPRQFWLLFKRKNWLGSKVQNMPDSKCCSSGRVNGCFENPKELGTLHSSQYGSHKMFRLMQKPSKYQLQKCQVCLYFREVEEPPFCDFTQKQLTWGNEWLHKRKITSRCTPESLSEWLPNTRGHEGGI